MRAVVAILALALFAPAAASAQDALSRAATALRSNPVYVDPSAQEAGNLDAGKLRAKIRDSGAAPMYIAVLPDAAGDPDTVLNELHQQVGLSGTYAVVVGRHFRAGSDVLQAAPMASAAFQEHPGDVEAALEDFIGKVGDARGGSSGGGVSGGVVALIVLVLVVLGGVWLVVSRRRARDRREEQLEALKRTARDDLVSLGEDIRSLEVDVGLHPAAQADYERAVNAYERANRLFETARSVDELAPAAPALEEGRWAIASTRARLEGRPPPERRPPCFFDPRHGPSVRDVMWAPPGGSPRPVPACAADALRVERGEESTPRELEVGGRRVPYYDAGPIYSPFYGGYFGGFGGFLPGLFLGEALSGWGWGDPGPDVYVDNGGWDAPGDDWGDPGGGDFGDSGGGDFGGGDFGGGDF